MAQHAGFHDRAAAIAVGFWIPRFCTAKWYRRRSRSPSGPSSFLCRAGSVPGEGACRRRTAMPRTVEMAVLMDCYEW